MTDSHREKYARIYRLLLVGAGTGVIGLATARIIHQPFDLRWLALAAFAIIGSWAVSAQIPGAAGIVTVSDTFVFLTMLLCGPEAATLVAAIAAAGDSARYVKRWL